MPDFITKATIQSSLLYGDADFTPPAQEPLRAGPLTLLYENGDLRRIRRGATELVNRLYGAVRDDNWGTPAGIRTEIEKTIGPDSFRIVYESRHTDAAKGIDFLWRGTLTGDADGIITFDFDGEALTPFRRNRIGICVLHPASLAGVACTVRHANGAEEAGAFPETISPAQPFFDIAAISFDAGDGAMAVLEFSGDVFEMEDQRNWLDASYKTYSTPLKIPYPVEVPAGTRIRQTVTLSPPLSSPLGMGEERGGLNVTITQEQVGRFPGFGLSLPADNVVSGAVKQRIGAVRFDHFRAEMDAALPKWRETLAAALRQAKRLDAPLMVAVRNGENLTKPMADAETVIDWLLVSPTPEAVREARAALPEGTRLGGAWPGNFVDLNRDRESAALGLDTLAYPGNPQIHAFDNTSIREVPPTLLDAQRTARTFADGKLLLVGPLTFYGPYLPEDARQKSLFGAAWYLAALSYAAQGGAERITLCELAGVRGVMAADGTPYPLYNMLSPIGTATGGLTHKTDVSDPTAVAALAVHSDDEEWQDVFVANLTPEERIVTLRGLLGPSARVRILDAATAPKFGESLPFPTPGNEIKLTLSPYAIAQVITGKSIE